MASLTPMIYGQDSKLKKFIDLSSPEKFWVVAHPFIASKALRISNRAKEVTKEESGKGVLDHYENGGKLDAFRHAFWMASLGLAVNPRKAIKLGKAHERGNERDFKKHRTEEGALPDRIAVEMDLWNNQIGINIAKSNPDVSEGEIRKMVKERIKNGNCKIIKKGDQGNFLNADNEVITDVEWRGKWTNERCLVMSNYND